MPKRPSKNVVQKVVELPLELAKDAEVFAKDRQQTFKDVVCRALRRHMDNPPPLPPPDPPLPDVPPDPPPAKKPRARRKPKA